jgi:hypothetical protein
MPSRDREPLLRVSHFAVLIGGREFGFSQVGPLTSEADPDAPPDRPAHRYRTVVLRRALTTSTELFEWRRHLVDGRDDRRDVTIRQLSTPGGTTVNAWKLTRAWPSRWTGPAFDALSGDIAFEEIELSFEDLDWIEHNRTVTGG